MASIEIPGTMEYRIDLCRPREKGHYYPQQILGEDTLKMSVPPTQRQFLEGRMGWYLVTQVWISPLHEDSEETSIRVYAVVEDFDHEDED